MEIIIAKGRTMTLAIIVRGEGDGPRPDPNGMGRTLGECGRAQDWARPRPHRERR